MHGSKIPRLTRKPVIKIQVVKALQSAQVFQVRISKVPSTFSFYKESTFYDQSNSGRNKFRII